MLFVTYDYTTKLNSYLEQPLSDSIEQMNFDLPLMSIFWQAFFIDVKKFVIDLNGKLKVNI